MSDIEYKQLMSTVNNFCSELTSEVKTGVINISKAENLLKIKADASEISGISISQTN